MTYRVHFFSIKMSGDVTARKRKKKTNPPLIQEKNLDPKKNPPVGEEKKRRQIEITKTEVEVMDSTALTFIFQFSLKNKTRYSVHNQTE